MMKSRILYRGYYGVAWSRLTKKEKKFVQENGIDADFCDYSGFERTTRYYNKERIGKLMKAK